MKRFVRSLTECTARTMSIRQKELKHLEIAELLFGALFLVHDCKGQAMIEYDMRWITGNLII